MEGLVEMKIHNEEYEIFLNKAKYEDETME
jgi:hypothetical protein